MAIIKLFHFTSVLHAQMILREGLSKGDVPTSPQTGFTGVWMTRDGNPSHQHWGDTTFYLHKGTRHQLDKSKIRITLLLDEKEPLLHRWDHLARKVRIPRWYFKQLNATGGGGGHMWYVYTGTLAPSKFDKVEYFYKGEWVPLVESDLPETPRIMQMSMSDYIGEKVEKIPVPMVLTQGVAYGNM